LTIADITFEDFIRFWARLSLALIVVEAYLTINKIWIRKHEAVVAESVSVSAQLLALTTGIPFVALYINEGAYEGAIGDGIILLVNIAMIGIGIGFWVEGRRSLGFWGNLKQSLRIERKEAGALVGELLHPVAARDVLKILLDMALIDGDFDERERALIKKVAMSWNIDFEELMQELDTGARSAPSFSRLRESLERYLAKSPPQEQASQLADVLAMLISVDESVSAEERMMMEELGGMIGGYVSGSETTGYHVFIAPQSPLQEAALKEIMPGLEKEQRLGGEVLVIGRYHSREYAHMVCDQYRQAGYLTVAEGDS
jgi:hypothetical protein